MAKDWSGRHLIYGSAGMAASGLMQSNGDADEENSPALQIEPRDASGAGGLKAAIVGETGAGNYGQGLDCIFSDLAGVHVIAVADPDEKGREDVRGKTKAEHAYAEFEDMLAQEKPDLVSIASGWTNQHFAMAKAALLSGAHIFVETPFTRTLAEADELLAIADQRDLKIGVAHQMSCNPHILRFKDMAHRQIGELVEMRVFGKMDERAGSEDSLVFGSHLFDLVRLFGGEVESCSARIRSEGRPVTFGDVYESREENLGPLLGDDLYAHLAMDSGVNVTFQSCKKMREMAGPWGIEFVGTKSKARLFAGQPPTFSVQRAPDMRSVEREDVWKQWPEEEPYHDEVDGLAGLAAANRLVVKDWLTAIANNKDPRSSGYRAMKSLEIIHGMWAAGLTGQRVQFPLIEREHPLAQVD